MLVEARTNKRRNVQSADLQASQMESSARARASLQLNRVLQRYEQAQSELQREREKVKEALLDSRNMAEVSMQVRVLF